MPELELELEPELVLVVVLTLVHVQVQVLASRAPVKSCIATTTARQRRNCECRRFEEAS